MIRRVIRALLKTVGAASTRREIWDIEYAGGKWDYLDEEGQQAERDIACEYVERYCNGGSILDLGCGTGRTGRQLAIDKYSVYVGVDISGVAIDTARSRCEQLGGSRSSKNAFHAHDMLTYSPSRQHDVILFQESLYYLRRRDARSALRRYSRYLTPSGVMIVRLWDRKRYAWIVETVRRHYCIVEQYWPADSRTGVIVFKPRAA